MGFFLTAYNTCAFIRPISYFLVALLIFHMSVFEASHDSPRAKLSIAIGSKNPVKVTASIKGISKALLENFDIEGIGFDVPSGVSEQPIGDDETKKGAINRAKLAYQAFADQRGGAPKYSVGMEGGIAFASDGTTMECFAWMCIFDGVKIGSARTASFALPNRIKELVLGGLELGDADDQVFGEVNSKQKGGTVGHLSLGIIDRAAYYEHAMILAMIPFQWPDLY